MYKVIKSNSLLSATTYDEGIATKETAFFNGDTLSVDCCHLECTFFSGSRQNSFYLLRVQLHGQIL